MRSAIILLVLPIKKQWFDMIVSGIKKEEYRAVSAYYKVRFKNLFNMYPYTYTPTGYDTQKLMLRNGYSKNSPSCIITASLDIKKGKPEWGAEEDKEYYVLKIYNVEPIKN